MLLVEVFSFFDRRRFHDTAVLVDATWDMTRIYGIGRTLCAIPAKAEKGVGVGSCVKQFIGIILQVICCTQSHEKRSQHWKTPKDVVPHQ